MREASVRELSMRKASVRHILVKKILLTLVLSVCALPTFAELVIEITQGADNPTPIAIAPMRWGGGGVLPEDVSRIISDDLRSSGLFYPIPQQDMLSFPSNESEVHYRDWRLLAVDYLVIGNIYQIGDNLYSLEFNLFNINSQQKVWQQPKMVQANLNDLRTMAHKASDQIYESLTGIRGVFNTKIAYVEQIGNTFFLKMSDMDGHRARTLVQSKPTQPILSPNWSADGRRISYVSFDSTRSAIYIYDLSTGRSEQITNFVGYTGAPSFSPDGIQLAFSMSRDGDGDADVYTLNLASREMKRVVRSPGIDTEPSWTADGNGLVFTSDRGANAQIYQVTLTSNRIERLTFQSAKSMGAVTSQDGKSIVYVYQNEYGDFYIAHQDIKSGNVRLLSNTGRSERTFDEKPTLAPNGALLMFGTKSRGKGILSVVSTDRGGRYNLPSTQGDVREPAWGPYLD